MAWTPLTFNSGDILGADSAMNPMQANFTALAQQHSGAPMIDVSCANADILVSSNFRAGVASFGTINVGSATFDNIDFNSLVVSDLRVGVASISNLHVDSANIENLNVVNFDIDSIITSELVVDVASINTLVVSDYTGGIAVIDSATITNLELADLSLETLVVSDLQAGVGSFSIAHVNSFRAIYCSVNSISAAGISVSKLRANTVASLAICNAPDGNINTLNTSDFTAGISIVDSANISDLIANNFQTETASISTLNVSDFTTGLALIDSATITNLELADLSLETLIASNARIGVGSLSVLHASSAAIESLVASEAQTDIASFNTMTVSDFTGGIASISSADIGNLELDNLNLESLVVSDLRAGVGSLSVLHAESANIVNLNVDNFDIDSIVTSELIVDVASINNLVTSQFQTNNASIGILQADSGSINSLIASDFRSGVASINLIHVNSANFINLEVESETNLVKRDEWLQNGFVDANAATISFSDDNRLFTINPSDSLFEYFGQGIKYTKSTADTLTIDNTEGIHAIYYDESTLTDLANPSGEQFKDIVITKALTALVYYNVDSSQGILYNEKHGANMAPYTHAYLHQVVGFHYVSGLALADFVIGNGDDNEDAQFSIASGVCFDEDLEIDLNTVNATTAVKVFFRDGTNWRWRTQTGFKCITFDGTSATRLAFDDNGTLTEVGNGNYVLIHVFASNANDNDPVVILGQAEYSNLNDARAGAEVEISNLVLSGLPSKEFKPIGSIIFETKNTFGNDVNARVVQNDAGENYTDWRTSQFAAGIGAVEHASLGGLTDGDAGHSQFALLAGRDGGQTLIGGGNSGDNLILTSCADIIVQSVDLIAENFEAHNIVASGLITDIASINVLNTSDFTAGISVIDSANIDDLNAHSIITSGIQSDVASFNVLTVSDFTAGIVNIDSATITNLTLDELDLELLTVSGLIADIGSINTLNVSDFNAGIASIDSAAITNLELADLNLETLVVSDLRVGVGSFGLLDTTTAHIIELNADSIVTDILVTSNLIADISCAAQVHAPVLRTQNVTISGTIFMNIGATDGGIRIDNAGVAAADPYIQLTNTGAYITWMSLNTALARFEWSSGGGGYGARSTAFSVTLGGIAISSSYMTDIASINTLNVESGNINSLVTSGLVVDVASINTLSTSDFTAGIVDISSGSINALVSSFTRTGIFSATTINADVFIGGFLGVSSMSTNLLFAGTAQAPTLLTQNVTVSGTIFMNIGATDGGIRIDNAGVAAADPYIQLTNTGAYITWMSLNTALARFEWSSGGGGYGARSTAFSVTLGGIAISSSYMTDIASINTLSTSDFTAGIVNIDSANIGNLELADLSLDSLVASDLRTGVGSFGLLDATTAHIVNLNAEGTLASNIRGSQGSYDNFEIQNANINSAAVTHLLSSNINASNKFFTGTNAVSSLTEVNISSDLNVLNLNVDSFFQTHAASLQILRAESGTIGVLQSEVGAITNLDVSDDLEVGGYTALGSGQVEIQIIKLTGVTPLGAGTGSYDLNFSEDYQKINLLSIAAQDQTDASRVYPGDINADKKFSAYVGSGDKFYIKVEADSSEVASSAFTALFAKEQ